MKLSLDYETRSKRDLKKYGTYVYSRDPSTSVLCAAYSLDGVLGLWPTNDGVPMPDQLRAAFDNPDCEIHAWNAQFERLITKNVLKIDVPLHRWRCTAAHARCRSLPGKLEGALNFLNMSPDLAVKRKGTAIMLKWCQPLPSGGKLWADDPQEYLALMHYCIGDVRSEMAIAALLAGEPLTPAELADYALNERVNDTGLPIDRALALAAQAYGAEERTEIAGWMAEMTQGEITSASQHARIKAWLQRKLPPHVFNEYFVRGDKVTADKSARADFLNSDAIGELDDPDIASLVEAVDDAGKASVAKFAKMAARAANGRAEGSYLFAGAGQTKRYSSTGIQMHNLPRQGLPDTQAAITQTMEHRIEGKVMHVLAGLLRPTIAAPEGHTLLWGDWASVEARGMPWLAGNQKKLDLYRNGVDVYKRNACDIFGVDEDDVTDHQRQVGKVAELSLQFGGSVGALKNMGRNYGISFTDDVAKGVVAGWRGANGWAAQFSQGLLTAFAAAVVLPGAVIYHEGVEYETLRMSDATGLTVRCSLPGGTHLYYQNVRPYVWLRYFADYVPIRPQPGFEGQRIQARIALQRLGMAYGTGYKKPQNAALCLSLPPWLTVDERAAALVRGDGREPSLTYTKALTTSGHDERVWHGLTAENATQALCAALLRDCLGRVEKALMKARADARIIGHTHDEIILEAREDHAKKAAAILEREMLRVPEWLPGFPLGCEVKSGPRYVK